MCPCHVLRVVRCSALTPAQLLLFPKCRRPLQPKPYLLADMISCKCLLLYLNQAMASLFKISYRIDTYLVVLFSGITQSDKSTFGNKAHIMHCKLNRAISSGVLAGTCENFSSPYSFLIHDSELIVNELRYGVMGLGFTPHQEEYCTTAQRGSKRVD